MDFEQYKQAAAQGDAAAQAACDELCEQGYHA